MGYPSDDINKFLWMVRIGGGVFPHIKEPDYLVRTLSSSLILDSRCVSFCDLNTLNVSSCNYFG